MFIFFLFFIRVSFHPCGPLISRQLELYYVCVH